MAITQQIVMEGFGYQLGGIEVPLAAPDGSPVPGSKVPRRILRFVEQASGFTLELRFDEPSWAEFARRVSGSGVVVAPASAIEGLNGGGERKR